MSAVTQWFDQDTPPSVIGPYQMKTGNAINYSFWNGSYFGLTSCSPEEAARFHYAKTSFDMSKWRGLADKP